MRIVHDLLGVFALCDDDYLHFRVFYETIVYCCTAVLSQPRRVLLVAVALPLI